MLLRTDTLAIRCESRIWSLVHGSGHRKVACPIMSAAGDTLTADDWKRPVRFKGRIATIGYEGRSIDEFISLLVAANVDILVDVREQAMSRRKGFSKKALTAAVEAADIAYRHEPVLGNPKANRESFRAGSEIARQKFLAHLNNGSRAMYDEIVDLARTNVVALVCFERAHDHCHRSCISGQAQSEHPSLLVERL